MPPCSRLQSVVALVTTVVFGLVVLIIKFEMYQLLMKTKPRMFEGAVEMLTCVDLTRSLRKQEIAGR